MKIEITTTHTAIIKDGYYKPTSPVFEFSNQGGGIVLFNQNFQLQSLRNWGIDLSTIMANFILKGIPVENTTGYLITFDYPDVFGKNLILKETIIKIIN